MFSISTQPAKQSVSETITTLSGRLSSSTLLEDRRAAILGLRSFAKDFPASVASGALRSLIESLSKDGEDVDTVKVVLETLLMLFSPNDDSPEASEEIALWLADEFTQRQENIDLLLNFLETNDFYSRLYALQLLGEFLAARSQRTEECILTAPLGISRLVSILDDHRDAIRNECVSLLTYLTPTSVEIQKLVAFENAFDKLLSIITADGSLSDGGKTVEDCLILLANLLRRNGSNQALFRESGCVSRLASLLIGLLKAQAEGATEVASWAETQKNRNVYAFLAVIRLFLGYRFLGTPQNQAAFWKHKLSHNVLQLAFDHNTQATIKAEALITCADMIRSNASLQEDFAQLMVTSPSLSPTEGAQETNGAGQSFVIDGLLELTLSHSNIQAFDVRFAACECLKAYFSDHQAAKFHFLKRAIEGYKSDGDEGTNVLGILLRPNSSRSPADPYESWFAAVITFHLLHDNPPAKKEALSLTEGEVDDGEEVVTIVQTIVANLITSIRRHEDDRILVATLMLLCGWLFEDLDAVNDVLEEGSNIQSLVQTVTQPNPATNILVRGLCALLLGIIYEFSTKSSPIPRTTLYEIFSRQIEREVYADRLLDLRAHPLIRDFEVIPQRLDNTPPGELPDVFFDHLFVEFFKDNYSRLSRSLDRDPDLEVSVITDGVENGVSRSLVDTLHLRVTELELALEKSQIASGEDHEKLRQAQGELHRLRDQVQTETDKAKSLADSQREAYESKLGKLHSEAKAKEVETQKAVARVQAQMATADNEHKKDLARVKSQMASSLNDHRKEMAAKEAEHDRLASQARKYAEDKLQRAENQARAEIADLKATISRLEVDLTKVKEEKGQALKSLEDKLQAALAKEKKDAGVVSGKLEAATKKAEQAEKRAVEAERKIEAADKRAEKAKKDMADLRQELEGALAAETKARNSTQTELDDLLMVFGDVEEKVDQYKKRLKELNEPVSDIEDADEDDGEDSDGESDA